MLLNQNTQHAPAFAAILDACSSVRAHYITFEYNFNIQFLLGGALDHDDLTRAMGAIWKESETPVRVPLGGAYYASIKPTTAGKYAAFDVVFTSCDKRRDSCVHNELYNALGGYWYASPVAQNGTAHKALHSNRMQSILSIVRAFNRAGVLATSLMWA